MEGAAVALPGRSTAAHRYCSASRSKVRNASNGDPEDALADQVSEGMSNLPRCAFVGQTPGERFDQAVHTTYRVAYRPLLL